MLKLFRIQPTDVAVVNFVSQPFPGRIAYGIAEDCTENDGKHDHPGTRRTRGSNGAGDEKERIARQKRHDDASRFQKEDDEHRDIDERAVVCRKRHEKMVGIGEKLNNQSEDVHGRKRQNFCKGKSQNPEGFPVGPPIITG